jgi:hydrogenase large subunit
MTTKLTLSPFARVDGDLRVELDVADGAVASARVVETFYRGFERMLRGREPRDGMVLTPRVCGQCSLAHTSAAARALRSLAGADVPANGLLSLCVMLGIETLVGHLTHLYLSLAPELGRLGPHAGRLDRFAPMTGPSVVGAVAARRELLPILGFFAGKWPNSLSVQPGGSTRPVDQSELARALGILDGFRRFIEGQVLAGSLDEWLSLRREADLQAWTADARHAGSDLAVFIAACLEHGLDRVGHGPGAFLSCGGWETAPGAFWLEPGFFVIDREVRREPLATERITEQSKHSWREVGAGTSQPPPPPFPIEHDSEAYSWGKAPRYAGQPVETGPLARLLCAGDPLVLDIVERRGPGAYSRALARIHEVMRLTAQLETWLLAIDPSQPFCSRVVLPESGEGLGLIEAPRGTLGHWIRVEGGRIADYQIVTPTAWNFSPRDDAEVPGPVESALAGISVGETAERSALVLWVVKSFDPCLYCSVH